MAKKEIKIIKYSLGEPSLEGIQKHRETIQHIKMLTKLAKQLGRIK